MHRLEGLAAVAEEGAAGRSRRLTLIGAPIEAGAGVLGCAMGPAMLRTAGIVTALAALGCEVVDRGDLKLEEPFPPLAKPDGLARNFDEVSAWARALSRATRTALREGGTPLVLGGDHSLAMGSLSGVALHAADAGR